MRRTTIGLMAVSVCLVAVLGPAVVSAADAPGRLGEAARAMERPAGAPKASDVIMRTLHLHPRHADDPHDTMRAVREFHVTRLAWSYVTDAAFIEKLEAAGRTFGGAASAPSFVPEDPESDWYDRVVIKDLEGRPIIAPWKRTWNRTLWGCINNPELERGYLRYLQKYIDAGAEVMQRDEPGANHLATRWGGCFCDHCMKGFRGYLGEHIAPAEREQLGIEDVETFDYRDHLKKAGAPAGDAFGRFNGGKLKELFVQFQLEATVAFHRRTRAAIDRYAGRRVPISCNNGARRWTEIQLGFDWAFGELSYGHARPATIHRAMREAARHARIQVVTMPKKGNYDNPDEWQARTRRTIATAYATGGVCMVPWDVYMPHDAPRYFGTPQQYADLFGFIRGAAPYLDGYEEAAAVGKGIEAAPLAGGPAVVLSGGSDPYAFVRVRPGAADAPVVVHLVDWGTDTKALSVRLRRAAFFGRRPVSVKLLTPAPYDEAAHERAEATGDFSKLLVETPLTAAEDNGEAELAVPALRPWGTLVVVPAG